MVCGHLLIKKFTLFFFKLKILSYWRLTAITLTCFLSPTSNKDAWIELVQRCEAVGVDAFELNFSCPHGLPERKMGAAMGQDPDILEEVCGWVKTATKKPVWAKMTPNITHIEEPGRAALRGGATGLSAINTIRSVTSINLDTLRPLRIPLPPLALQQQFASLVARHERLRAVQREALRQAEHLFQSLLHRAFTK